jgi:hypothetical protein
MASKYIVRICTPTTEIREDTASFRTAKSLCRRHLGRLHASLVGGDAYVADLVDAGYQEVAAWFADPDGYGNSACIYRLQEAP